MLIEHPEICHGCLEWVHVENRRFVEHEVPWAPQNAHERRQWRRRGKPKCSASGEPIQSCAPTIWIESH